MMSPKFVLILLAVVAVTGGADALAMDYYSMSCPFAEMIVQQAVFGAVRLDPAAAAGLLRLHFHDCFVQGCDASVLIDSTPDNVAEKDAPPNLTLRGYDVVDQSKRMLEASCPGIVSCADVVALAARDAVFFAGGPYYPVPTGRRDGTRSKAEDTAALPSPTMDAAGLIQAFGQKGFTVPELVALSGGHTLGVSRCSSFTQRLHNFSSAHDVDPTMDASFAATLSAACGNAATVPLDATPAMFDASYFGALQRGQGVLASDQALFASPQTQAYVNRFSPYGGGAGAGNAMFYYWFQQGITKMGQLDVKEGSQGEVRLNCRKFN